MVSLRGEHQVLSTSEYNGGLSHSIRFLVNHQSMEPNADQGQTDKILNASSEQYHASVAKQLSLQPPSVALMSTAASMNHIACSKQTFQDLEVHAFVTAGVHSNALRAGDQANWYATEHGNKEVVQAGTINTIVLINKPLMPGALVTAAAIITEAKSSALVELAIPSSVSPHIATGTGTDQFAIASKINSNDKPLVSASGHLKLGELIGSCVRESTLEALRWQSGLERSCTQTMLQAMGRFGLSEKKLFESLKESLPVDVYSLLANNRHAVLIEPRVVAAAYAFAAILDRIQYGTLSKSISAEVLRDQAANIAVGVSSRPSLWCDYWRQLPTEAKDPLTLFIAAIALGWKTKWLD